jgi:hypothetical protein
VVEERELRTTTLAELLHEYLPGGRIDFLSVDVARILGGQGYELLSKTVNTAIFTR